LQVKLLGDTSCFQTCLRFYEFNDNMEVQTVQNYDIEGYAFIHDFAITEDSIVLMVNATSLHLTDFVLGRKSIIHCIPFDKDKPLKVRCA
jgi:all-trans-8'-apo-beta-carotenal 15,15'-oxygenase